jgi:hypothetical protein
MPPYEPRTVASAISVPCEGRLPPIFKAANGPPMQKNAAKETGRLRRRAACSDGRYRAALDAEGARKQVGDVHLIRFRDQH